MALGQTFGHVDDDGGDVGDCDDHHDDGGNDGDHDGGHYGDHDDDHDDRHDDFHDETIVFKNIFRPRELQTN